MSSPFQELNILAAELIGHARETAEQDHPLDRIKVTRQIDAAEMRMSEVQLHLQHAMGIVTRIDPSLATLRSLLFHTLQKAQRTVEQEGVPDNLPIEDIDKVLASQDHRLNAVNAARVRANELLMHLSTALDGLKGVA